MCFYTEKLQYALYFTVFFCGLNRLHVSTVVVYSVHAAFKSNLLICVIKFLWYSQTECHLFITSKDIQHLEALFSAVIFKSCLSPKTLGTLLVPCLA